MIKVKLYNPIANKDNAWWWSWDGQDGVFSFDYVQKLFRDNPTETDFQFNIHCAGGEVEEGLAIYDFLRTSGKNIHMNIEGGCHSMAVTLLLAAPKENRSANPNCLALIHQVQGGACGSTSVVEAHAKDMRMLQDRILDIYAERTGSDRAVLESIMNEEREHTAQELFQLGFISKINSYNTNLKTRKEMKNAKEVKKSASDFLNAIQRFIGCGSYNYEFVDENGEVLFTTEEETDTLEVGMSATPDGTFTIADGRTIVIADGVITEIQEATEEETTEETTEESEEVANLRKEIEDLKAALSNSADIIKDLRSQVKSDYVPGIRVNTPANNGKTTNKEDIRDAYKSNKK